jgi:hypothetical protein
MRSCSKVGCAQIASVTLTYVYDDRMVVVGPLSPIADPHALDLCPRHEARLVAPNGWLLTRRVVLEHGI